MSGGFNASRNDCTILFFIILFLLLFFDNGCFSVLQMMATYYGRMASVLRVPSFDAILRCRDSVGRQKSLYAILRRSNWYRQRKSLISHCSIFCLQCKMLFCDAGIV